jgi:hypothetical protein
MSKRLDELKEAAVEALVEFQRVFALTKDAGIRNRAGGRALAMRASPPIFCMKKPNGGSV